jgi:hypothetical protein
MKLNSRLVPSSSKVSILCSRVVVAIALGASVTACSSEGSAKRAGELQITVSAEGLGANGYAFPPTAGQELAFVDGWDVKFARIIVAIDNIRLSEMPDKNPGDQSVVGAGVVTRHGPFVVDLKQPGDAEDKGMAGRVAIRLPIDDLVNQFDLAQRYAFSYDLVAVTSDATFVNVEADDPDVLAMIQAAERALLTGHAEFKGDNCQSRDDLHPYPFATLPQAVDFRFGLEGNVSYVNCQNPDNWGQALEGEQSPRGVQLLPSGVTTAQITIHTDHLFWPKVSHENLPHFDQYAANASLSGGAYQIDLEQLKAVPVTAITDSSGLALQWRSCVDTTLYDLPKLPTMSFDPGSQALTNLYDFVQFNAASMGHLNADGLCYVKRD